LFVFVSLYLSPFFFGGVAFFPSCGTAKYNAEYCRTNLQTSGCPGPAIIHKELQTAACLDNSEGDPVPPRKTTIPQGDHDISPSLEGTTQYSTAVRQIAPLLDKTGGQINGEENFTSAGGVVIYYKFLFIM
jgi:hypothetical protein